jgi:hypothetical protein
MKCNMVRVALAMAGVVFLNLCASPSLAAPTVFFDRDDATALMTSFPNSQAKFNQFTATLSSFGVDGAESAAGFDPTLVFGGTGITAASQGALVQAAPTFQIGTQALLESDAAGFPQVNTSFTFNQHITAFGLFVIQAGDGANNNNPITFRLTDTATSQSVDVQRQVGPGWGNNNVFFFGVTDTVPFNQVTLIEAGDMADGMLYDNVVAGIVPEPGSLGLMALGALALGRAVRRRGR